MLSMSMYMAFYHYLHWFWGTNLQKNILEEHEILKVPTTPLQISHKLFESKHAPNIQEKESVPDDVPKQIATSAADANPEFFFLSFELMHVWKKIHVDVPLTIVLRTKGSNNVFTFANACAWFEGENIWWFSIDDVLIYLPFFLIAKGEESLTKDEVILKPWE